MTPEAKIGVTKMPAKECQALLAATSSLEEAVKDSSIEPSKVPANALVSEVWSSEL